MRRFLFCLILIGLSFQGTSKALAENWIKAETDNFIVYSNINQQTTNAFAIKLEQFRLLLNQFYLSREQQAQPSAKLEVYLTRNRGDFKEVNPSLDYDVAGFVVTGCVESLSAFSHFEGDRVSLTAPVSNQTPSTSLEILLHEYVHLFMAQNSAMAEPRWYIEGVAEYYSTMLYNNSEMVLGYGSDHRLAYLEFAGKIKYEDILRDDPSLREDAIQSEYYAQSWLLTNYLLHNSERTEKLHQYFEARNNGEDPVLSFERIFGLKIRDLSGILSRYLSTEKTKIFNISRMPNIQVNTATLPKSAEKLLLWDAALKTCPAEEYGPKLLAKINDEVQKHPSDEYAKNVLSRAQIILGDEAQALEHFKNLTEVNPNDAEAFYRLGQVYYEMARKNKLLPGKTEQQQIALARAAFGRSYQLNPLNTANLYHFSLTAAQSDKFPDDSSLNAATEAFLMAPSNRSFAFNVATMLIYKENFEEARIVLNSIANNSHAKKKSPQAALAIAAIDAKKSKAEVLEALLRKEEPPSPGK